MNIICSPDSAFPYQFGMYNVQHVQNNTYKATLKKFSGDKLRFPGVLFLQKITSTWVSSPEGHTNLVNCLSGEIERLVGMKKTEDRKQKSEDDPRI